MVNAPLRQRISILEGVRKAYLDVSTTSGTDWQQNDQRQHRKHQELCNGEGIGLKVDSIYSLLSILCTPLNKQLHF